MNISSFYQFGYFAVIILVTWLAAHFLTAFSRKLLKRSTPLVATHVTRLVWMAIWSVGILVGLEQLGLQLDLLLVLIGVASAAIIVANKNVLENIAAKYFSDVYVPFKVGDSIRILDYAGRVIEINPISTILITDNEELASIPNALFMREVVVNTTLHAWKEISIPIIISDDIDLPEFESEVLKNCNKMRIHLDERFPPVLSIRNRDQRSVELVLRLMIKEADKKDVLISEINSTLAEIMQHAKRKKRQ